MDYILETRNLIKHYKNGKALNGLTMHVEKGAIYGFVGRNGAGKTTLIRLICGLQEPTEGTFTLYGCPNDSKEITRSRRRMGAVVETPSIYLSMTAEENLKQQYQILGLPSYDGLHDLLELVRLGNTGKKKAKDFSLGMRQRLGIAVALAGDPDFLILDELSRLATHYGFIDNGRMVKEISAPELEASCRKCLRLTVSDARPLIAALDKMGLEYSIRSDTEADVYDAPSVTELTLALHNAGCEVKNIHEHDESLESYYMNLVGGTVDD